MEKFTNKDIADHLKHCAQLMELKGDNPFKTRAFTRAARTIENLPQALHEIPHSDILQIKGVGKNIGAVIFDFLNSGNSAYCAELREHIPDGLIAMLKIPGLGVSKIRSINRELNISSIRELEYAILENRLKDLKGFGEKTQDKIYQSIQFLKRYESYHLLPDALNKAQQIKELLMEVPTIRSVHLCGALRRHNEIIEIIELLICCEEENRTQLSVDLEKNPQILSVENIGKNLVDVRFSDGYTVHFHLADEKECVYSRFYHTGSPEHIRILNRLAAKQHMELTEEGFSGPEGKITVHTERDIYQLLHIPYVIPEMREPEHAEIKPAENLIASTDIKGLLHVHSVWSDGKSTISELAAEARSQGYSYLGITDHSKSSFYANGLSAERIKKQHEEIDSLNDAFGSSFKILKGIECDILSDGSLDYDDGILALFDFVIVSVHQNLEMDPDRATDRILRALRHPRTNILAHPTGRLLLGRKGYQLHWDEIFNTAREQQIAIEINANPHRLDMDWRVALTAATRGIYTAINPDAHRLDGFAHMEFGIKMAQKANYTPQMVINSFNLEQITTFFNKQTDT